MPNTQKVERVAELKERIEGSTALLLTEYRGLTVAEIAELRRSLRDADTTFAVIKNTLMARAAADAGIEELQVHLSGPSAVAFVAGDPVAAAKAIMAAAKQYPALILKAGYMDGAVLDQAGAGRLADLESREVMLSKIAGMLQSEMTRAAAAFVSAQSTFLSLLEALREKLPADDAAEAAPAEAPSAEAAPAEAAEGVEATPSAEAEGTPDAEAEATSDADASTEVEGADGSEAEATPSADHDADDTAGTEAPAEQTEEE
jgi:large subunit ribosomal protein L10